MLPINVIVDANALNYIAHVLVSVASYAEVRIEFAEVLRTLERPPKRRLRHWSAYSHSRWVRSKYWYFFRFSFCSMLDFRGILVSSIYAAAGGGATLIYNRGSFSCSPCSLRSR